MKFTKKQRFTLAGLIYLLSFIIVVFLVDSSASFTYYLFFFYGLFFVITIVFEEDLKTIFSFIVGITAVLSLFIFLILWIFQIPILTSIPLFKSGISNEFIIAFFTVALTISTIINLIIYKKSLVLSRLTILNAYLDHELFLVIKNIGQYPATRVKISVDVRRKNKIDIIRKKRDLMNLWNNLKLIFWVSEESNIAYLEPTEKSKAIDIYPIIKKHFRNLREGLDGMHDVRLITSSRDIKFRVVVTIHYFNDAGDMAPAPIIRSFKVTINRTGVQLEE